MLKKTLLAVSAAVLPSVFGLVQAGSAAVAIDMSANLNFDAFGELGERSYAGWYRVNDPTTGLARPAAVSSTAYDVFGDHNIAQYPNNGRMYVTQAIASTIGTGGVGAPTDYLVGDFEIGKGMALAPGYTRYGVETWTDPGVYPLTAPAKVNQTLLVNRTTQTISLLPAQQGKYSSFNLLFSQFRATNAGSYSTVLQVNYLEDGPGVYTTVWEDVRTALPATTVGGTLASAGAVVASDGTWEDADGVDANLFGTGASQLVQPVVALTMNRFSQNSGSPGGWGNNSGNRYMWTLDADQVTAGNQGILLDSGKTVAEFRFTTTSSSSSFNNRLYIYGITAEPIPEPAAALLVIGAGALVLRRRAHV